MNGIEKKLSTESSDLVRNTIGMITKYIRTNDLVPGDRLPSESQVSRDLNVSRTVVREAFRSLSAMRLINLSVGKRATVAELDYASISPMVEHGIYTEQINVQQIYDVRRTIEMRTVMLAALRRSDAEAKNILNHACAMRNKFDDPNAIMEHDLAFHLEIAKAGRNPVFTLIVGAFEGVSRQTWPIGWRSRSTEGLQKSMIDIHIKLAEAIVAGDPQLARDLMAIHFDESVKALITAGIV